MGRKDIMENYVCTICGKVIKDFNNGLFVKIKDKERRCCSSKRKLQ